MLELVPSALPAPLTLVEQLSRRPVSIKNTTHKKRGVALARGAILDYIRRKGGDASAIREFRAACACVNQGVSSALPLAVITAVEKIGRIPSKNTIYEWFALYRAGGADGLVPKHEGGAGKTRNKAWRAECASLYNQPSKPTMAAVHRRLAEVRGYDVTYDQVCTYLRNLPATSGEKSPARQGKKFHKLNQKGYVSRTTRGSCETGEAWAADGYCADVYLAHPVTGDIFRPELTVALDIASRQVVHWRLDEHEGTTAVQNMWAEAIAKHGHRPLKFYVDNGSGHRNILMSDELTGFYARVGVDVTHAFPGNPHGKGWIERFVRSMKDDFIRLWRPEFYCGKDMAQEVKNRIVTDVKRGRREAPSVAEFADAVNAWIERRAQREHPEFTGMTIAEKWAELKRHPPMMGLDEMRRRAVKLTVARARVTQGKRAYKHPDLYEFNGREVILEYDLMDDSLAVIRTLKGEWICDAHLVKKVGVFNENRMEELRRKRAVDAVRRLEKKKAEQLSRAGRVLDADALVDSVLLSSPSEESGGDEINLFDF
jgi:putative transposase